MIRAALAILLMCAAVAVPAPQAGAHDTTCDGIAPVLNTCSAGRHTRTGDFIQHGPDYDASSLYTGTIVSYVITVESPKNAKLTCHIFLGERQGCIGDPFNQFPSIGESFTHTCISYTYGTESAGGIGPWGCKVSHA